MVLRFCQVLLLIPGLIVRSELSSTDPTALPWPDQLHAELHQTRPGQPSAQVSLYYDWPGGRNLHIIRKEGEPALYDNERQSGLTYYYTPSLRKCKVIDMKVGILRPDWLKGAKYLGQETVTTSAGSRLCNVWQQGEAVEPATGPFAVYYADASTGLPARWRFFTNASFDVLSWMPGEGPAEEAVWDIPAYCDGLPASEEAALNVDAAALRGRGIGNVETLLV